MSDAPLIRDVGLTGLLITFSEVLTDAGNRAALAFCAALRDASWPGVLEISTSLTSAFVRYDPFLLSRDALAENVASLLDARDWRDAPLPGNRRLWRIPVVLGGEAGPQFEAAAEAAGVSLDEAATDISKARLRVLTIGFAPGQGYLGTLPAHWDVPRRTDLNPRVPSGALVAAIRQLIIFTRPAPTGWLHIGQTGFRSYRPEADAPFPLTPGDEVSFEPVPAADLPKLQGDPTGGATSECIN